MLPYAVAAAARLKRARSALIMHDLYPDVLVMAGLLKPASLLAKAIRGANALMFRALNAVIIIGRDTEPLLLRYKGVTSRQDPVYSELGDAGAGGAADSDPTTPIAACTRRASWSVFPAILALRTILTSCSRPRDCCGTMPDIHFLLSGWGIGFERLKQLQSDANLPNVTLVERVPEQDLEAVSCRGRYLAHSLPQAPRRRLGAEPVLQSAGDRPAGAAAFRSRTPRRR